MVDVHQSGACLQDTVCDRDTGFAAGLVMRTTVVGDRTASQLPIERVTQVLYL